MDTLSWIDFLAKVGKLQVLMFYLTLVRLLLQPHSVATINVHDYIKDATLNNDLASSDQREVEKHTVQKRRFSEKE